MIATVAILFLAMGIAALAAPARILATFGVPVTTVDGRNEVRAVYGGFGVAMAAMLLGAPPALAPGVAACLAAALAGMAIGRLVSAAIDGGAGVWPWCFCGAELVGAAMLASTVV